MTIRKVTGYDQYSVPDTVAIESSIVAFFNICRHISMTFRVILSIFFEEQ